MHSVVSLDLATFQTPLAIFIYFFQKAPSDKSLGFSQTLFSFWDSAVLPRECDVLHPQRARTHAHLSVLDCV